MARLPASPMCRGVSKSGCPTSRRMAPGVSIASLAISRIPEWADSAGPRRRGGSDSRAIAFMVSSRRLPTHYQDPHPKGPHDQVDERDHAREVGGILGPLEGPEVEALVKALQIAPAGQVDDDARRAREEPLDQSAPNTLALPRGHDGDRGQLTTTIPMRLNLAHADDRPVLLSHHEVWPIEAHGVQLRLLDEAADRGLIRFGRRTDGRGHMPSTLSPGSATPSQNDAARPKELCPPAQPHRVLVARWGESHPRARSPRG